MARRRRVSIPIDEGTLGRARELAELAGLPLSTWVRRAVRFQVRCENAVRNAEEVLAELPGELPVERLIEIEVELSEAGHSRLEPWPGRRTTRAR